ncbi:helix-turn-helix domain-containing protein [Streptomyces sp. NPDC057271]|uniref:helix-turn-helix domain-containing protein n=1 Tax=unclassified Streptomyces TaxID=2593676 RepID=UPI00363B6EEE
MARISRATSDACRHGHPFPENLVIDGRGWASCRECRRAALRRHWRNHGVLAAPDESAVERAVRGDKPPRLTPRERLAAVSRLDRRGLSARQVAEHIGCTQRTVHRIRGRVRQTAA